MCGTGPLQSEEGYVWAVGHIFKPTGNLGNLGSGLGV